ncbi:hypothetical protein SEPCBS57363_005408 [Sporothrix epigloea]|uniref:BHLH domain-containing protein n=1 Tax=Sporothrix epigloea TaxID=1892477 RepID=A0ABP0DXM1_9PEZI
MTSERSTEVNPDESGFENNLSDDGEVEEGFPYPAIDIADQVSAIDSIAPTVVPHREGLYSTPLSWERPQMVMRFDSMLGFQTPTLSEAEQRRLIAHTMNPTPFMGGLSNSMGPSFNSFPMFGPGLGSASLGQMSNSDLMSAMMASSISSGTQLQPSSSSSARPEKQPQTESKSNDKSENKPDNRPESRSENKSENKSEKGKEKPRPISDRTAHNDIERKYRTNLKDRIAELRDAVPSLCTIPENSMDDGDGDGEGSNQTGRAPKVSKVRHYQRWQQFSNISTIQADTI